MALLIALLYRANALALPDHQPTRSAQFIFLLVTAALWLGLIDSCREIVKERPIIIRELNVGVRLDAYLIAKATLLFALGAVQCTILLAVATAIQPLHSHAGSYIDLGVLLILTSWSTIGIGLVVSTVARSVDQATSLIPLLLIPQLLFGGALVAFDRMSGPVKALSDLMVSRWAFAAGGHVIDMSGRLLASPRVMHTQRLSTQLLFSLSSGAAAIVLLGFTALLILVAAALLATRSRQA